MAIKFYKVNKYKDIDLNLPIRKTAHSAGYDMEVAEDILLPSYTSMIDNLKNYTAKNVSYDIESMSNITKAIGSRPTLVSTGMKCELDNDEYLQLSIRSSSSLKYWLILANGTGIIDSDYYNNKDNEGEIFFQVINMSPVAIELHKGDIIGQAIICKYDLTDDDCADGERTGGLGSTTKDA